MKKLFVLAILTSAAVSCATVSQETPVQEIPHQRNDYKEHIRGAEEGNPADQLIVGVSLEEGNGVPVDYEQALDWYEKAAGKGDPEAYYRIGHLYETGKGVSADKDAALEWYLSSAVNSFLPAIERLIELYEDDTKEQLKWIKAGREAGDPYSSYCYGLLIEPEDREKAIEAYLDASGSDNIHASAMIAILSLGGKGKKIEEAEAWKEIEQSALAGNERSLLFAGWMKEFGIGTDKSYGKALEFYEEAARLNNTMALFNLSRFYGEGLGTYGDPAKADFYAAQIDETAFNPSLYDLTDLAEKSGNRDEMKILYTYRASRGDLEAQFKLGRMEPGEEGLQWYWISAQEGYVPSMVELAKQMEEKDKIQAAVWLMLAENKGYKDENFTSKKIMSTMSRNEKLEVSRIFTDLFYREQNP